MSPRPRLSEALGGALIIGSLAATAGAQTPPTAPASGVILLAAEARCRDAFAKLGQQAPTGIQDYCESLAVMAYAAVASQAEELQPRPATAPISAADVQPESPDAAGSQGSVGQASAAPRGTPVVFAGGTLALAGTGVGTQAVTSISLNPLSLLGDEGDTDEMAFKTRFADVSIVLPFNITEPSVPSDGVGFVGVRARVNFLAQSNGQAAVEALNKAYNVALPIAGVTIETIRDTLKKVDDPAGCVRALGTEDDERVAAACAGLRLTERGRLLAAEREVSRLRAEIVAEADNDYLGLDLRVDVGDQNLSLEGKQAGSTLLGAVAFGRRLRVSNQYGAWLRGRAGANYQDLEARDRPLFEGDGLLGFAVSSVPDRVGFDFETAIAGRYANDDDPTVDTDFLELKLSVGVPFSAGAKIGFGVALPLLAGSDRDRDPVLTVAMDWGLGLSGS